ncbi:MAG: hypothetical protein COA43_00635 [Robiginitomaculum sp.]|nr:MAG: hypothetical protein COA43_00635 [Robiginitomaculum sp.]
MINAIIALFAISRLDNRHYKSPKQGAKSRLRGKATEKPPNTLTKHTISLLNLTNSKKAEKLIGEIMIDYLWNILRNIALKLIRLLSFHGLKNIFLFIGGLLGAALILSEPAFASAADNTGTDAAAFQGAIDTILLLLNGSLGLVASLLAFVYGFFRMVTNFSAAPVLGSFGIAFAIQIIPDMLASMFTSIILYLPM